MASTIDELQKMNQTLQLVLAEMRRTREIEAQQAEGARSQGKAQQVEAIRDDIRRQQMSQEQVAPSAGDPRQVPDPAGRGIDGSDVADGGVVEVVPGPRHVRGVGGRIFAPRGETPEERRRNALRRAMFELRLGASDVAERRIRRAGRFFTGVALDPMAVRLGLLGAGAVAGLALRGAGGRAVNFAAGVATAMGFGPAVQAAGRMAQRADEFVRRPFVEGFRRVGVAMFGEEAVRGGMRGMARAAATGLFGAGFVGTAATQIDRFRGLMGRVGAMWNRFQEFVRSPAVRQIARYSLIIGGAILGLEVLRRTVGAVVRSFTGLITSLDRWTTAALESQRRLARASPAIRAVFARLDRAELMSQREFGQATAGSTFRLADATARFRDFIREIQVGFTNFWNDFLADVTEIASLLGRWAYWVALINTYTVPVFWALRTGFWLFRQTLAVLAQISEFLNDLLGLEGITTGGPWDTLFSDAANGRLKPSGIPAPEI